MDDLLIVKIGGNIVDNAQALDTFLSDFASLPGHKILVHGGGKLATELSAKLGVETKMVDGRRITDMDTLRIVTMTYAGWINKNIVAILQAKGADAIGLCGADGKLLPAVKRPVMDIDYGLVGDLLTDQVNRKLIDSILAQNKILVVAPITSDHLGQILNVNADTVAQTLAEAMSSVYHTTLVYCFEKKGVLADAEDEKSVIGEINGHSAAAMKENGVISKGMVPKIDNALKAINNGVQSVVIGHAADITMIAKKEQGYGTRIVT